MFRLACIALVVLAALAYSSEAASNSSFVECSPLDCGENHKNCAFGFRKDKNECETCECHEPCKPIGEVRPCEEHEECSVEKSSSGQFVAKCHKHIEKRAVQGKKPQRDDLKNRCSLPKTTGPCRRAVPRYFYDAKKKQCERFTFGGCKGNQNNFPSKRACESACRKRL